MKRFLMEKLLDWKDSSHRLPLIINGARQVGKTWLLQEFGRTAFKNTVYVNCDTDERIKEIFNKDFNIDRILGDLEILMQQKIVPGETLLIFDEIQETPKALTSLKYFAENKPELAITAAGSLLGLTIHEGTGFPVGKVTIFNLYPLSFFEFLYAMGEDLLCEKLQASTPSNIDELDLFSDTLIKHLKTYLFVGGMPGVVKHYVEEKNIDTVRTLQESILEAYRFDLSKHLNSLETNRAIEVLASLPNHLSRENKRFIFGQVRDGGRGRDYEDVLSWLQAAGLIVRVFNVTKPGNPLAAYRDPRSFKIFFVDVGLLGALSNVNPRTLLEGDALFTEFKGALTEQFVCQELLCMNSQAPFYWSGKKEKSMAEIDFLVQNQAISQGHFSDICAVEAKASVNLKAKSLSVFHKTYPQTRAFRLSLAWFREESWVRNIPLFAFENVRLWDN